MQIVPLGILWIPVLILFVLQEEDKESKALQLTYLGYAAAYVLFVFLYAFGV